MAADSHIAAALAGLREGDREVLTLLAWDGLTPAQASESLGCSRATFAVRLHRARRRLERELALAVSNPSAAVRPSAPVREVS